MSNYPSTGTAKAARSPSPAQAMNLLHLCEQAGETIPHLETRSDARREIRRLLELVRRRQG